MDELDEDDDGSYEDDSDNDNDFESELGDTLDVNAITRDRDMQRDSEETPKRK